MQLIKLVCPNCGANLEIGSDRDVFYCSYCGTKLTFPKKTIHYEYVSRNETDIEKAKFNTITRVQEAKLKVKEAKYNMIKELGSFVPLVFVFLLLFVMWLIDPSL